MDQGEGVEGAALKRDPLDFALWKAAKEGRTPPGTRRGAAAGQDGTSSARRWRSHCSASISRSTAAASDLIFPHHENEAAQTCAAHGEPLARLWMHNGMIRLDQEKMSKSVGNIFLLGDALDAYGRDALIIYFARRPLPAADRVRRGASGARRGAASHRISDARRGGSSPGQPGVVGAAARSGSSTRSQTTSTRRRRWPRSLDVGDGGESSIPRGPVGDADLREMLGVFALENVLDAEASPSAAVVELRRAREGPEPSGTSRRPTGSATNCGSSVGRSVTALMGRS